MANRCQYLRTKTDYVAQSPGLQQATGEVSTPQRHYWCLRTMKPLGPDGVPVDESLCVRGRDCFLAEGEE